VSTGKRKVPRRRSSKEPEAGSKTSADPVPAAEALLDVGVRATAASVAPGMGAMRARRLRQE